MQATFNNANYYFRNCNRERFGKYDAINAKNTLLHQRFRQVVMFQPPDWLAETVREPKRAELEKRMKVIADQQAEIYKLAQPVPHKFEVKPAAKSDAKP